MRRPSKSLFAAGLMLFVGTLASAQDRAQIVAVNYPLQFLAEQLAGDAADVTFPVPQDVDPSFWRPAISDISAVQAADLILLNGAGFATWVDRVSLPRSKLVNTSAAIEDQIIVTESITHSHGDGDTHSHEGLASYVWLDPGLAIAQAQAIAAALTARGLAPADEVTARLATLTTELESLDATAQSALQELSGATLIATHPRYHYFARRYGMSILSMEWDAGAMPDDRQLAELEALAAQSDATVLIWEAQPPDAALDATRALDLRNVVFPPLAHAVEGQTFLQGFAQALSDMADVAGQ